MGNDWTWGEPNCEKCNVFRERKLKLKNYACQSSDGKNDENVEENGDKKEFEVKSIESMFLLKNGETWFEVSWVGFPNAKDNTFEPLENLLNCKQLLKKFFTNTKSRVKEIKRLVKKR